MPRSASFATTNGKYGPASCRAEMRWTQNASVYWDRIELDAADRFNRHQKKETRPDRTSGVLGENPI